MMEIDVDEDGLCPHGRPPEYCGNCHEELEQDRKDELMLDWHAAWFGP